MSDKYEFIAAERATHSSENSGDAPTIVRMCAWIGVSKSGYYEWLDRRPSAAAALSHVGPRHRQGDRALRQLGRVGE